MPVFNPNVFNRKVFNCTLLIVPPESVGGGRRITYIDRKYEIPLINLKIICPAEGELPLNSLSIYKFDRIITLISSLEIVLPFEIESLFSELSLISKVQKQELSIEKLKILKSGFIEISSEELNLIVKKEHAYLLNGLNLVKLIQEYVHASIPNIYTLKMKKLAEYLELLDLLDELNGD